MTDVDSRAAAADDHDRRLRANVHPLDWINPTPKSKYDLVVVGAGTGGLVTAAGAAGLGASVALIEMHQMGGDCLNVGCVPSKGIIAAARAWHGARSAVAFGGPAVSGDGNFGTAMERMRRLRADLSHVDSVPRFAGLGVDVFLGRGQFTAPDRVEVGGAMLRFKRAVIATGARASAPPIPGLAEAGYLTNETIFSLTELPPRLLVLGAGPIGCEMAQSFARFGSQVTVLDRAERILHRDDPDASAVVQRVMIHDGVAFEMGTTIDRVDRQRGEVLVTYSRDGTTNTVRGDALLVAVGRAPNVEHVGLDLANVAYGPAGVTVDDRLRTTNRRVFAVGDVCSRLQFTHSADFQARLVIANALFFGRGRNSNLVIPWCTYTSPEVAHVGITPDQAAGEGVELDTVTVPFDDVDRAVLEGETEGFLRIHLQKGSDRILGVTIVDAHAGDLLGEAAVAVTRKLRLGTIGQVIYPYPTKAEAFRKASDQWRRGKLTPLVRRIFAKWFQLLR
ncbi:MAG: mercuric reductase [Gemmatimonadetes bacterium]|nr:mercuric reductase [Gemmatimonadota bacterium]